MIDNDNHAGNADAEDDAEQQVEQSWVEQQRAERLARVAGNPPACSRATLQLFH